jgi:hypothetical protein
MGQPKLQFSLTYLGQTSPTDYHCLFQTHKTPPSFKNGDEYKSSNGWYILGRDYSAILPAAKIMRLGCDGPSEPRIVVFHDNSAQDAKDCLRSALDALQEWVASLSSDTSTEGVPLTEEVRESLLFAEDADVPEETEDEGPGPVYLDELVPAKISLS